ncbi:MAG TPA: hypothetical protein VHA56_13965 [Mucilaginibacter sp.]|nr:hypothetical protein [Mucilaginibacter sp.]
MKIRSKTLYAYLLKSNVLHGTQDDIALAKLEYRKIYKRQWKQQKRPRKEIRIEFTLKDFQAIKTKASVAGISYTAYARNILLLSTGSQQLIPRKEVLLKVLQLISMAVIASTKNMRLIQQLTEAEDLLLQYLKQAQHE